MSLIPVPDLGFPTFKLLEIDKLIHFLIYSIFIIVWGLNIELNKIKIIKLVIYSILLGLFLEILQHALTFGRYFDLGDIIANSVGAIIGIIILLFYKKKLL